MHPASPRSSSVPDAAACSLAVPSETGASPVPARRAASSRAAGRVVLSVTLAAASLTAVPGAAPPPSAGQTSTLASTAAARLPVARAWRVERGPAVDGDVLGEAVWSAADALTGFRQNTPDEGEPASERTEVRIVYTDDAIYFGVVCYVRDPATIIVSDARRDSSLVETDSFQIVLDTYRDHQNGFVFGDEPGRARV